MDGRCHRASALHTSRVYYVLRVPSRYQSRICFLRDPSRPWRLGGSHFQPVVSVTLYLGSYERESHGLQATAGSSTIYHKTVHRHSIGGFAVYTRTEESGGGSVRLSTILKDHLGSTDRIVTGTWNGTSFANHQTERQSFDPWGERRDPATFVNFRSADTDPFRTSAADYDRGYTGHEQLDDSGLIHMNGRIYDPELGRMLSPDPFVQVPEYSQNFNRYSYVLNNPLNKTDPSGYSWLSKAFDKVGDWISENWRQVVVIVVAAVLSIVTAGIGAAVAYSAAYATAAAGAGFTTAFVVGAAAGLAAQGAIIGAVAGGLGAALAGGDLGDIAKGMAIGAVEGAVTAPLHLVGGSPGMDLFNIVGHGVIGGASNVAMGGKFQDGFLSAAASAATAVSGLTSPNTDLGKSLGFAGRTAIASAVGGTAAAIGGGKFANGAVTGAFHHIVNAESGGMGKQIAKDIGNGLNALARSPFGYTWNLPNTALGLAWGGVGLLAEVASLPFTRKWDYSVSIGHNAIQFVGHNFAGSAETLGNTISYAAAYTPDSYGPNNFSLYSEGHTIGQHELQHTYQGQMLGPLYIPAALVGMGLGVLFNGNSHGSMSFMERGPQTYGKNRPFNFSKDYISPY